MFTIVISVLLFIGIGLFIVNWVLNKSYNIKFNTISQYANGSYGYLTTLGFLTYGAGVILAALNKLQISYTQAYSIFAWLLFSYGVGMSLLSAFKCNKPGESTWRGKIHDVIANIAIIVISATMIYFFIMNLLNGVFIELTLIFTLLNLASVSLFLFASNKLRGIWERCFMFSQFFWVLSIV